MGWDQSYALQENTITILHGVLPTMTDELISIGVTLDVCGVFRLLPGVVKEVLLLLPGVYEDVLLCPGVNDVELPWPGVKEVLLDVLLK